MELLMDDVSTFSSNITFNTSDLMVDYENECQIRGLSPSTIEKYLYDMRIFNQWLDRNSIDIVNVNRHQLKQFISYLRNDRNCITKTVGNIFSSLSSFYDFLAFEELITANPIIPIRKRYLHRYKSQDRPAQRQIISVEQMAGLIYSIMDCRDKTIVLLLAKTGIRRGELIRIDVDDIDFDKHSIHLKPRAKRTNCMVFFDDETAYYLREWLNKRKRISGGTQALFVGQHGKRLQRNGVYTLVSKWASVYGIHNPNSPRTEDHFSPHCCRHWFTTHLRRAGMSREFIKELRGDSRREAIDIYDHIDPGELRREYLDKIPQLGV